MATRADTGRHAPQEVDAYLAPLGAPQREALERLRALIHELAPGCTERVSYRIPIFRLGRDLVALSAHRAHLALHTLSPAVAALIAAEYGDVRVSGATIHFTPERPLPREVVSRVIEERRREIAGEGMP